MGTLVATSLRGIRPCMPTLEGASESQGLETSGFSDLRSPRVEGFRV